MVTETEIAVPLYCRYWPHRYTDYSLHPSVEPAASFQALMRTGGWLQSIAHTLVETTDQQRARRSAADRSAACRASNVAMESAGGRLPTRCQERLRAAR